MREYEFFANVYDRMMKNIPYGEWEQYLLLLLFSFGVQPEASITELGCGTGTMTRRLARSGFKMTGIDLSQNMLRLAKEKGGRINYVHMDMRELDLPEKQDAIISVCDSVNYLLTNDDLTKVMKGVYDNLKDGGVFIFDLKTEYLFKTFMDGNTYRENMGDFSYVWKNHYDEKSKIHTYDLKFKYREDGKIKTAEELHKQRVFSAADIRSSARMAGFGKAKVYQELTLTRPRKNSERIYVVMKK